MLHRLATELEHHEDDHLVVNDVTMMALVMAIATRIEQDIAIVITMVILMVTKNQAKTDDAGEGAEEHGQDDPQVKSCSHLGDVYPSTTYKHRKNCECCPGHSSVSVSASLSVSFSAPVFASVSQKCLKSLPKISQKSLKSLSKVS